VVLIVAVALLASVSFAALIGRPRHDSIAEHQRAVETLRDIAERAREHPERAGGLAPTEPHQLFSQPPDWRVPRARPPMRSASERASARRSQPDYSSRPTVASLPTIGAAARPGDLPPSPAPVSDHPYNDRSDALVTPKRPQRTTNAHRFGGEPGNRFGRTRRTFAVAAVVAAIATSAVAATHSPGPSRDPHTRRAASVRRTTSPPRTSTSSRLTTTTVRQSVLQPTVAAGGNATFRVAFPVTLTLRTTHACWVLASNQAGQTLYTGTLQPSQQQQIQTAGALVVRVGNSSGLTLFVNNVPAALTGVANTATLTFTAT
jgi:hypothetical protein